MKRSVSFFIAMLYVVYVNAQEVTPGLLSDFIHAQGLAKSASVNTTFHSLVASLNNAQDSAQLAILSSHSFHSSPRFGPFVQNISGQGLVIDSIRYELTYGNAYRVRFRLNEFDEWIPNEIWRKNTNGIFELAKYGLSYETYNRAALPNSNDFNRQFTIPSGLPLTDRFIRLVVRNKKGNFAELKLVEVDELRDEKLVVGGWVVADARFYSTKKVQSTVKAPQAPPKDTASAIIAQKVIFTDSLEVDGEQQVYRIHWLLPKDWEVTKVSLISTAKRATIEVRPGKGKREQLLKEHITNSTWVSCVDFNKKGKQYLITLKASGFVFDQSAQGLKIRTDLNDNERSGF